MGSLQAYQVFVNFNSSLQKEYLILKVTLLQVNVFSFMTKSHKLNLHEFHREKSAKFTEIIGFLNKAQTLSNPVPVVILNSQFAIM